MPGSRGFRSRKFGDVLLFGAQREELAIWGPPHSKEVTVWDHDLIEIRLVEDGELFRWGQRWQPLCVGRVVECMVFVIEEVAEAASPGDLVVNWAWVFFLCHAVAPGSPRERMVPL